ncbi:MAG TPA: SPFH domain-containing protein [Nocardioidaceae bacterium]|nr:SPFH domain-containing protein [Nocardioidaceae bacterium]
MPVQTLIAVGGILAVVVLLFAFVASRYKVAGPNQAFLITGRKGKSASDTSGQKVVLGGGVFVMPVIQQRSVVDLSSSQIGLKVEKAPSNQGISLNVQAVAVVKVGGTEDMIRAAAQRFQNQQQLISNFTTEVLEGELRSIVGTLTVEQIIQDRASFAAKVAEATEASLSVQGLVLDSFSIKDVADADGTYLRDLGRPDAARIKQAADIAEAEARLKSEEKRIATEEQIAIANRALELKKAEIKAETDAAAAQAQAAGPLAKAARDQEVLAEQEKVAARQATLTERQLEIDVRKPADAARYRVEQEAIAAQNAKVSDAEAEKAARIARAEAAAIEATKSGQAERDARIARAEAAAVEGAKTGEAEKARREAIADAVRVEGQAEAAAIAAKGSAEAEALEAKAEAYTKFNEAAVLEMLVKVLPEVAHELAAPMGNIDKLTVVSTDGASQLPKQLVGNLSQVIDMVSATTGLDVAKLMAARTDGAREIATSPNGGAPEK